MKHIVLHDGGSVELRQDLGATEQASWMGILKRYWDGLHVYREDGVKLRARPDTSVLPIESWWWRRILAYTVYNPRVTVPVAYEPVGAYMLGEVRDKIISYLPSDDDIIQQFLDVSDPDALGAVSVVWRPSRGRSCDRGPA